MAEAADRTIPATPRRREAARREGLMPTAAPLSWAAAAVVALLLVPAWARAVMPAATAWLRECLQTCVHLQPAAPTLRPAGLAALLLPTIGLVLAAAATGLAVRLVLDGLSWQPARTAVNLARVDLFAGLVRIVSVRTLVAACGNAAGLGGVLLAALVTAGPLVAALSDPASLLDPARPFLVAWRPLVAAAAAAIAVAAGQYAVARLRFERRLRMTPQEFTDEARNLHADPKIRLLHRQRARQPPAARAAG